MSSILDNQTVQKFKKSFLWAATGILITEAIFEAIMIMFGMWNASIGKIQATFLVLAVFLFVGVNNLIRIEKGDKVVRSLALAGLITGFICTLLVTFLIWEVLPFLSAEKVVVNSYYGGSREVLRYSLSFWAKMMFVALSAAVGCFWTSNVMAIKETVKPVKPLKITALVCEVYCCLYSIVMVVADFDLSGEVASKSLALSGLAGFTFVITALAAFIISRVNRKNNEKDGKKQVNEEEMQAAIKDMVEKEVQQRMAAERAKQERDAMPPLQSEDMAPTVSRDNEVKLDAPKDSESEKQND